MGLVAHAGGWKRPDAVADKLKADAAMAATLAEYKARRDRALVKADDHWKLAQWCEENGLEAEAKAHLTIVTRIDPNHAAARKRLGYKKQGGRWVTDAQLAEEKADAELQKKADRAWKPRLEKYRAMLAGKDEAKRAEARRALLEVTDPRAVPAVWAVFGTGSAARQEIAVQLLGQIDGPAASRRPSYPSPSSVPRPGCARPPRRPWRIATRATSWACWSSNFATRSNMRSARSGGRAHPVSSSSRARNSTCGGSTGRPPSTRRPACPGSSPLRSRSIPSPSRTTS